MTYQLTETELAIFFHDTYERLAPEFGYETRQDTKVFDPESKNGKLMVAVCKKVLEAISGAKKEDIRSKESQKQTLIELMEADQRDGIYGVRGAVDNKIAALLVLTDEFIFPAYYSHTDKVMWKIANVYTKYNEETLVLCGLDEGIEAALDVAIKVISEKRKEYYGLPIEPNPDPQNTTKEPVIDNLRDKFFKECTDEVSIWEGETDKEPKMKKVNLTPHNTFEWFKPYLKSNSEPVIDNLTEELINVRDFLYIIAREAKNRFPNDSLHLTIEGRIPQIENLLKRQ